VVATPLGNLEDITLRALKTLRSVALVACEDTRHTARLLGAHDIRVPLTSYFEHNERWKGARILEALRSGRDVALVSDAGTPGISDPGYRLVRDARAEGLPVIPIPGPSAAVSALSVSGLPTDRFLFESPLRAAAALRDMAEAFGDREAFLCREATKLHEEYRRGRLAELGAELEGRAAVKGEIALVVAGAPAAPAAEADAASLESAMAELLAQGRTRRQAAKEVARRLGLPAREVYRRTLGNPPGA
jgi:16S rRNA (cytidine1402-2'-O)-methyltransferase